MRKTLLAMTIAAFGMGSTAAIAAPAPQQAQQAQMQQGQDVQVISDAMLEKFADAMSEVRNISNKYAEEFQSAEDAEQAQSIQQQAQQEMVEAVNDSGLSPEEYNTIVQRVQQDEELRARLETFTDAE
ncbi:protein of unknown function [Pseudidiomarina planktonica]|uniref:DUF4168 domain-containing protein n=2 Tax=Pseudidiomarina planktonica TaxID=1323738 RepID=A0A1Y6E565_9GAMM|nr:DUF4168 domain-containing protein [Pseudidiomarina planktonica]SMQ57905.1 protein of unknown function [Pseudidiomarina planktonica]